MAEIAKGRNGRKVANVSRTRRWWTLVLGVASLSAIQGSDALARPSLRMLDRPLVLCTPPSEKIGDHRYRIGRVLVDTTAKTVTVPCRVNMRRGVIEYLAVASEGKLHESVLLAEAEPLHVHLGLLLLGMEPGPRPRYQGDPLPSWANDGEHHEGAGRRPTHARVEARVTWSTASGDRSARLEELAWDIPARKPMPSVTWCFTGAALGRPRTAEQRSLVATYCDPEAVLNNPLPTGSDDTVYKANERLLPPVGVGMTLVLRPAASDREAKP